MTDHTTNPPLHERPRTTRRGGARRPHAAEESSSPKIPSATELPEFPIRLADVLLYDLRIERNPELLGEAISSEAHLNIVLQQPLIVGQRMEVGLKIVASIPNDENPSWTIDATFHAVFQIAEGTSDELVRAFAQSTVMALIWPYARELFQNLSIRMRVAVLMLPTLDTRYAAQTTPHAQTASSATSALGPSGE